MTLNLTPLLCRTDNYIWVLHNDTHAWVVDPSLAAPVRDYIAQRGLILADILITHHHYDHVEGIAELLPLLQGRVIGASSRIAHLTENYVDQLAEPVEFKLSFSEVRVQLLPTFGHTYDHVSYFLPHALSKPLLFCGDTIFSAGCGRLFDGTMAQLYDSFVRLMQLPDETVIACTHEYTVANLAYALAIDSAHEATQRHDNRVKCAVACGEPSLPTVLALEKQINPYMRCVQFDAAWVQLLIEFAGRRGETNADVRSPFDAFTLCRRLKNTF